MGATTLLGIDTSRTLRCFVPFALALAIAAGGCKALTGGDATPAATATPAPTPTLAPIQTPEETPATPEATDTATPEETPTPRGTPVRMETPTPATMATPRPSKTPREVAVVERTPRPAKTPRGTIAPVETDVVDLAVETPPPVETPTEAPPEATPEPEPETPPESGAVKVASLSFGAGNGASLVKVDASATAGQSIVDVQLSAPARYKILPLPNRRQVWVDLDLPVAPEPKTIAGSGSSLVKEISVKAFEAGTVRVIVQLKDDGKPFPVILPKKRAGESATIQVRVGPDPE